MSLGNCKKEARLAFLCVNKRIAKSAILRAKIKGTGVLTILKLKSVQQKKTTGPGT